MNTVTESYKIPVPTFLKLLTSNNVPVKRAMSATSLIYKEFNTAAQLAQLTDIKLKSLGVNDKEDRKLVLAGLRKAGYIAGKSAEGSTPSAVKAATTPVSKKKRKRVDDLSDLLPDGPQDEASTYGSLEFEEVLDEEILRTKSTIVNRAPLMTAWATVVAERMGFQREEALSIASVYTEMNAISKGVSIGVFDKGKKRDMEASRSEAQPYVDLMGRRIALYQTQSSQWRALLNNTPALPSTAFSYISRSLRQTTRYIMGALRLLAMSYSPRDLNGKGFVIYADFRPAVEGWGKRGEVRCDRILEMKNQGPALTEPGSSKDVVKTEDLTQKKPRVSLEDFEATLGEDDIFNNIDLDELP